MKGIEYSADRKEAANRCKDCFHWHKCQAFGYSQNPDSAVCHYNPSKYLGLYDFIRQCFGEG